ncbi:hypothetical protein HBH56_080630 [Parastagonospora nodorum]|uniref:Uncharacterized protein n=1 Tax=Phaeosphaeria nodorum (strain SN15 / ATCC MYA-4574 / FGSC 10173) TaxID=321614 RepID=A0A7U2F0I6_PHANO|nr:hypothetical protein HBH56_080630 [Parastagonospora nodorum]QRC96519.1 hypothetical protein JI435_014340 [Parastagonospora nodorum SN15]KAH3929678.1 hypothetical protein HBH54_121190 [Parastagonospora nodorum]KAH4138367.1 hypothetical protein HBH45_114910 [Parastagonospora nodorum]KAH4150844.1 hypothetical protein HBH44_175970 [Parastagonospora nodorum]
MNSAKMSSENPTYDATEDPVAPYRLSLLYTPEDPLNNSLPSSIFAPGELGDLRFPNFLPMQDTAAWEVEQIDYPWEQRLVDRTRLVESTQPLEEYTREEGLQAIEEFDWSTPEDGLDLIAASSVPPTEVTATDEVSSQHEDERPGERQKLETHPLSTDIPVSPPWIASPLKAPTLDSISTPTTVSSNLEIAAIDGGESTDAIIEPEATHRAIVGQTESEPTKTTSSIASLDPLDLSAVREKDQGVHGYQSWDSQLQEAAHAGATNSTSEILPTGYGGAEVLEQEPSQAPSQARPASTGSAHRDVYDTITTPSNTSGEQPPPLGGNLDAGTTILASDETASKSSATPPTESALEHADASDIPLLIPMTEGILKQETTPNPEEQAPLREKSKTSGTSKSKATSRNSLKISSTTRPAAPLKRPKALKTPQEVPRERFGETSDGIIQHDTNKTASAEIYFEEDTRPLNSPIDARTRREEIQAPLNDDEEDVQERLTDTSETKAYQRPPRNPVSNRELAALGSTFTPGMHLGLHHGQSKRARQSISTRDSSSSSDVEITSVKKKKRDAPARSKKPKLERTQAEIEHSEEEHSDLFPAPKYAAKGRKLPADKRTDTRLRASSPHASDVEEKPRTKRNSLLKNTLMPSVPVKNKFGFSPRKPRTSGMPASAKGNVRSKGKGKKADNAAEESTRTPLTRRKSQQLEKESQRQEKDANIGKRLRSKD